MWFIIRKPYKLESLEMQREFTISDRFNDVESQQPVMTKPAM